MSIVKLPKDARQSVRYNSELIEKLKEQGWTVQKLFDWAIEQKLEIRVIPRIEYDFDAIVKKAFHSGNTEMTMDEDNHKDFRIWAMRNGMDGKFHPWDHFEIDVPGGILKVVCEGTQGKNPT